METGTKECSRCGIRYCSVKCQNVDWKHRHKNHCEVKNVRRAEIIFAIHKTRLEEYKTGKTSCDRYFSIALIRVYKEHFPEASTSLNTPAYRVHCSEESSGRILTVLEDHEIDDDNKSHRILRGGKAYLVNPNVPSIPSSHKEQQLRLAAGLPLNDATELVPLNEDIQLACFYNDFEMIKRAMRYSLNRELQSSLIIIEIAIAPGLGWGYGNPVFLSLKNALAYEDFIHKNFGFDQPFPFNLCCSILFPDEYNPSLRTGNPEDVDKVVDLDPEDDLVDKEKTPVDYTEIFDTQLMKKEEEESFKKVEGESEYDGYIRFYAYSRKCDPMAYVRFNLAEHCSESLAVVEADQSCFPEGCPFLV